MGIESRYSSYPVLSIKSHECPIFPKNVLFPFFSATVKALWKFDVLTQVKVEALMDTMEQVDNMMIKNRDIVFEP